MSAVRMQCKRLVQSAALRCRSWISSAVQKRSFSSTVTVEKPENEFIFPRENVEEGLSYELNWSLCGSGVVPQGKSFRNLKSSDLVKAGGSAVPGVPKVIPWSSALEKEVTNYLGSENITRYVQDSALGALLSNEVPVRIVTDNAHTALQFKTWLATTKVVPLPKYQEDVTVLAATGLSSKGAFISYDPKSNTILLGGSSRLDAILHFLPQASVEAFVAKSTLPLWGSLVGTNFFSSKGFEGNATINYGCAFSSNGFCRLFMGSISEGSAKDEYRAFPNSIPVPSSVVLFANDATATIPAASKLSAAQAAYFYVGACAPTGLKSFANAAKVALQLGEKSQVYMVNRGAFASPADANAAALGVVGTSGTGGALGLEVINVEGAKAAPAADVVEKTVKALVASVEAKCKGLDAVLAGAPKL